MYEVPTGSRYKSNAELFGLEVRSRLIRGAKQEAELALWESDV